MNNSLSSIFVLALMCFTIGYGFANYPEIGILEVVEINPTDNDSKNLSSICTEHTVGMSPKDNSVVTEDIKESNNNILSNKNNISEKFNSSTSVEPIHSEAVVSKNKVAENTALNQDSDPPVSVSEQPIPIPEPLPIDAGDGDIAMPIPANKSTMASDSLEEKDETETKPAVDSVANAKEISATEKKHDPFGMDEQLSIQSSTPEEEKKVEENFVNTKQKNSQNNTDAQKNIENPIRQVAFEHPIAQNRGTIPRKTIPLDNNDEVPDKAEQPANQENMSAEKNLPSNVTSTSEKSSTDTNTTDSTDLLPSSNSMAVPEPIDPPQEEQGNISSLGNTNSTNPPESVDSQPTPESTELEDNLGFQIPESGYIPVKRFPTTEKAVEPIYYTNMDRFILE